MLKYHDYHIKYATKYMINKKGEYNMSDSINFFADSSEKEIATLGGGYLRNFLSSGVLGKGFCTVTDKRVYFKGNCYSKMGSSYRATKEEKTVDLKDITGSGFKVIKNIWILVMALISSVWFVFSLVGFLSNINSRNEGEFIAMLIFGAILPTVVLWVLYFLIKIKVFEITFAGGEIAFKASNYSVGEIENFQKALRQTKDAYKEASSTTVINNGSGADELKKYKDLLDQGVISQEDFENAKKKILGI